MILVNFNLNNANGQPTIGRLNISPINAPFVYSGSIINAETITLNEFGTGSINLAPAVYDVRELGYEGTTWFLMDISSVTDGTTASACNYIISGPVTGSNFTASYALNAGTASYCSNVTQQVYIGSYSNPNSYITPSNPNLGAMYFQDNADYVTVYLWSVQNQNWFGAFI